MSEILLKFQLNGESVAVKIAPDEILAHVLRDRLGLKGTKIGCAQGECGACTVLINGVAYNSCLVAAVKAMDAQVETIEGLAKGEDLHPLQTAFINTGAVQCGFCTPGMILSAKALLDKNPQPTKEEIRKILAGNICRCTGYVKIEEAVVQAAQVMFTERRDK